MPLPRFVYPVAAFALAAGLSTVAGRVAVTWVEETSRGEVADVMIQRGYEWVSVLSDGLQVVLSGEAETEADRFRAISAAGTVVDASRVIDNMDVKPSKRITIPDFTMEILRNDSGVSLIGLIPTESDRTAMVAEIKSYARNAAVTDLLNTATYPVPDLWEESFAYAMRALQMAPHSKISLKAGEVRVTAIAESPEQQRQFENALSRSIPDGVKVAFDITAPRPVITPFTLRAHIDEEGVVTLDACSAENEEARASISAALAAIGLQERANCTIGLGSPSRNWAQAARLGLSALKDLGGGTLTMSDADITLTARENVDVESFELVVGRFENRLPEPFSLKAEIPEATAAAVPGTPQFYAALSAEGKVTLSGRVPDERVNTALQSLAQANFGTDNLTMGTRVLPEGLPEGWSLRTLAAVAALGKLANGAVAVSPESFTVRGETGTPDGAAQISRALIEQLGQNANFTVNVSYNKDLDPLAALLTPAECVAEIGTLLADQKITFDPGAAQLSGSTIPLIDKIAGVIRKCVPDLPIMIAGYTDSQGRDEMNLDLSQKRAEAVLQALRARRVPVASFVATGFGEADPIASNDNEAGREANRRIEFSLIGAEKEAPAAEGEEAPSEDAAAASAPAEDAPQAMERPETRPRPRPAQ